MPFKRVIIALFLSTLGVLFSLNSSEMKSSSEEYLHAVASLTFYIHQLHKSLIQPDIYHESIPFSQDDVHELWQKVASFDSPFHNDIENSQKKYQEAQRCFRKAEFNEALLCIKQCSQLMTNLWKKAIDEENLSQNIFSTRLKIAVCQNKDLEKNTFIPYQIKKELRPYVISDFHPMKAKLDSIFFQTRATQDEQTFLQCGFHPISVRECTHLFVASHPILNGYLVKAFLDTELKEKMDTPNWKWLIRRCKGANNIRTVIKNKKVKHFIVADKWIYPLPAKPSPPHDGLHKHHFALLLVTDMDLVSHELNYEAWKNTITTKHLDELYIIISRAKGSSYRPDNIAYTKKGKFAFIDTEYPSHEPDFNSIRPFLNSEMLAYWNQLVKNGGK